MTITSPALKQVILDLIIFEDKLSENAQRTKRTSFPKSFFRGIVSAREKLLNQVEIGIVSTSQDMETITAESIEWVKRENSRQENKKVIAERYLDEQVELSEQEIKGIKYCYEDREEIPSVGIEVLDELEALLGIKKD